MPTNCPSGKILNPDTKRCVKVNGRIGKSILARKADAPSPCVTRSKTKLLAARKSPSHKSSSKSRSVKSVKPNTSRLIITRSKAEAWNTVLTRSKAQALNTLSKAVKSPMELVKKSRKPKVSSRKAKSPSPSRKIKTPTPSRKIKTPTPSRKIKTPTPSRKVMTPKTKTPSMLDLLKAKFTLGTPKRRVPKNRKRTSKKSVRPIIKAARRQQGRSRK